MNKILTYTGEIKQLYHIPNYGMFNLNDGDVITYWLNERKQVKFTVDSQKHNFQKVHHGSNIVPMSKYGFYEMCQEQSFIDVINGVKISSGEFDNICLEMVIKKLPDSDFLMCRANTHNNFIEYYTVKYNNGKYLLHQNDSYGYTKSEICWYIHRNGYKLVTEKTYDKETLNNIPYLWSDLCLTDEQIFEK